MEKIVYLEKREIDSYPKNSILFHPSIAYPEYIFGSKCVSDSPNEVYDMVRESLHGLGMDEAHYGQPEWNPLGEIICPGELVVIKPNIVKNCETEEKYECTLTHPSVIRAVIDYCVIAKAGKIILGDAPIQGADMDKIRQEYYYDKLMAFYHDQKIDVDFVDFRDLVVKIDKGIIKTVKRGEGTDFITVELGQESKHYQRDRNDCYEICGYVNNKINEMHHGGRHAYIISKYILEADVIINLPKPKTHRFAGITGAQKNFVGACSDKESLPHFKAGAQCVGCLLYTSLLRRNGEEKMFVNKILLITGGTGSFGNAVLNRFLDTDIKEIRILSRDEKKQDDMRHEYQAKMPEASQKIKFFIGDIRDLASVKNAMHGVDYIFHAAALKQVPSCEFFPIEAVKTNVLGTENVLTAAIDEGVKAVICLSTDKAAYPVNAMGTSKAMMEKVIVAKSRTVDSQKTKICCTRYGNVMCSRGSVIPLWIEQIKAGNPITITEPSMTRFIMSLEEAVDLVLFAFEKGASGDILVQKAPACTIETLAKAVTGLFAPNHEIKVIGIRHGEKMYETLLTNEECAHAEDLGNFYRVPCDKRNLNYDKYFKEGDTKRNPLTEFNSNNTELLGVEQVKEKLLQLTYIREELTAWEEAKK